MATAACHQPLPARRRRRHHRLAAITRPPVLPLDTGRGHEGPRALAVIDEAWCIGCTLCIKACPVDCIVGANKLMHTVIDAAMHRLRAVCAGVPGGLHRHAARHRAAHRLAGLECTAGRRGTRTLRLSPVSPATRSNGKTTNGWPPRHRPSWPTWPSHSQHTDPAVLDAKRAVIEAAMRVPRPRQARPASPDETAEDIETFFATLAAANPPPQTRTGSTPACSNCWPPCCCRRRPPT
jgi:electron transport complex protein RnfB